MEQVEQEVQELIHRAFAEHLSAIQRSQRTLCDVIPKVGKRLFRTLRSGGKIAWCGNGGSAAEAQHLAAELVGRFQRERGALASIAFTADTAVLTAIGNDYGFEEVFARQVLALLRKGDILVAISTSGNSENIVEALKAAKSLGVQTVGLLGYNGGRAIGLCDLAIIVPEENTARTQEIHLLIGHILCEIVDQHFSKEGKR